VCVFFHTFFCKYLFNLSFSTLEKLGLVWNYYCRKKVFLFAFVVKNYFGIVPLGNAQNDC
jgi:hypothetical protein